MKRGHGNSRHTKECDSPRPPWAEGGVSAECVPLMEEDVSEALQHEDSTILPASVDGPYDEDLDCV
jgi:hypothetical protein